MGGIPTPTQMSGEAAQVSGQQLSEFQARLLSTVSLCFGFLRDSPAQETEEGCDFQQTEKRRNQMAEALLDHWGGRRAKEASSSQNSINTRFQ